MKHNTTYCVFKILAYLANPQRPTTEVWCSRERGALTAMDSLSGHLGIVPVAVWVALAVLHLHKLNVKKVHPRL